MNKKLKAYWTKIKADPAAYQQRMAMLIAIRKTPEYREKMRVLGTKRKHSKETKEKLRIASTGRIKTTETRMKLSKALKGKPHSEIHNARMREALKGRKISKKSIKQMVATRTANGSWGHTAETKLKISKKHKGRKMPEEQKKKIAKSHMGLGHTKATRKKLSKIRKGRKLSKETREKMSRGMSESIRLGKHHPNTRGIGGWFYSKKNNKNLHFRSLLEKSWYEKLEIIPEIKSYQTESFRLAYFFDGIWRNYLPDIKINYVCGKVELIEIKPEDLWQDPQNLAKWKAGKEWCAKQNPPAIFKTVGFEKGL